MAPFNELPRPGADRLLSKVRGRIVRNDGADGHGEELRENRVRLLERDHDSRVVGGSNPAYRLCLASREILGTLDRKKWPTASAFRLGIEHPLERGDDVLCGKRSSVVKLHAAAQMESVGDSIGGDVPGFREAGNYLRVGGEARQSVEDVGDGASCWDVGRERGIHRSRIIGVARVDDGLAGRSGGFATAAAAENRG